MHFTFIALTPIIDVVFLSYQYNFFACKLSAEWEAELMALGEGRALIADRAQQTSLCTQPAAAPQRNSAQGL